MPLTWPSEETAWAAGIGTARRRSGHRERACPAGSGRLTQPARRRARSRGRQCGVDPGELAGQVVAGHVSGPVICVTENGRDSWPCGGSDPRPPDLDRVRGHQESAAGPGLDAHLPAPCRWALPGHPQGKAAEHQQRAAKRHIRHPGSSRKLWERQNLTGREASTPIGTRTDTTLEPMPSCTDKSGCTVCKPSTLTGRLVTAEHDRLESGANAVEGLMGRSPRYRLLCPRQQCGTDIDALRCRCTPPIQQRHGYPAGDTYLDLARLSIPIPPSPGREAVD
jgi:hypothetical protein